MITLEQLPDVIKAKLDTLIVLTPEKASQIGMEMSQDMRDRIHAGEATPALKETTVKAKQRLGYSQPETPLLATGDYAESFTGEFVDTGEMRLVNDSHVKPQWSRIKERTLSVINMEKLMSAIKKVLLADK